MSITIENEIVLKRINEIKPYLKNPRVNEKTVELLEKIIPVVGFNVPLVIDPKGIIVKGHARYIAAMRLGMEQVPCIITHASAKAIRADRITDNKIQEFTYWDKERLKEEIGDIDFDALGISLIDFGFIEDETDVLLEQDANGGIIQDKRKSPVKIQIIFKDADTFRVDEEKIRNFLSQYEKVEVDVGAYDDDY